MHDAAQRDKTLDQLLTAVHDPNRKYPNPKDFQLLWSQGVFMNHALYYGIDLKFKTLPIDETTEQLAVNFFDYFSRKNQLQAKVAKPVKQFYRELYNLWKLC